MSDTITVTGVPLIDKKAPKHHEWGGFSYKKPENGDLYLASRDYWTTKDEGTTANFLTICVSPIRTHHDSGVPIEFDDLPSPADLGDHVERVEYYGIGLIADEMEGADNYIHVVTGTKEWNAFSVINKEIGVEPTGMPNHYARVWYKRPFYRKDGTPLPDPRVYGDNVERLEYATFERAKEAMKNSEADFCAHPITDFAWSLAFTRMTESDEHYLLGYYKKEPTAQEVLGEQAYKVGDRVKVTRKAEDFERGWESMWCPLMDEEVGNTLEIIDIDQSAGEYQLGDGYVFPSFVCELVERAKPKPTTLADLVGEDGQKNAYLHWEGGSVVTYRVCKEDHETPFGELIEGTFDRLSNENIRWSHSPFTKYEDANEFVVEGGGSDESL